MHQGGSGRLRIRQVEIRNSSGHRVKEMMMDETFEIIVRFEVMEPVRAASIGIGISTFEGTRIATLDRIAYGIPSIKIEPGFYQISVELVNFLLPGNYSLDVGAHAAIDREALHYVLHARSFSVSEISQRGKDSVPYNVNYRRGIIRVDASWSNVERIDSKSVREASNARDT
jgi:hypothetical protein